MNVLRAARQSPALALAALALVFAMVGTAIAGPDAVSRAITKSKVKTIAKKQADKRLKANVSGSHVNTADTATNATNATNATSANNISGVTLRRVTYLENSGAGPREVLNVGGLVLTAACTGGVLTVNATYTAPGEMLSQSIVIPGGGTQNEVNVSPDPGDTTNLLPTSPDNQRGSTVWATLAGSVVTVDWFADNIATTGNSPDCSFVGTATQHG